MVQNIYATIKASEGEIEWPMTISFPKKMAANIYKNMD